MGLFLPDSDLAPLSPEQFPPPSSSRQSLSQKLHQVPTSPSTINISDLESLCYEEHHWHVSAGRSRWRERYFPSYAPWPFSFSGPGWSEVSMGIGEEGEKTPLRALLGRTVLETSRQPSRVKHSTLWVLLSSVDHSRAELGWLHSSQVQVLQLPVLFPHEIHCYPIWDHACAVLHGCSNVVVLTWCPAACRALLVSCTARRMQGGSGK